MVKQAHIELEKTKSKEDAELKIEREFQEQVLFSNEIGMYLLRIGDVVHRINADDKKAVIDKA